MRSSLPASRLLSFLLVTVVLLAPAGAQTVLHALAGEPGEQLGRLFAAGDTDGDGVPDLVVGSPEHGPGGAGRVRLLSGADGGLLWDVVGTVAGGRLGHVAAPAGDVDGDGIDDVLAGAPGDLSVAGRVLVLSGADGSTLRSHARGGPGDRFGWSVASTGDVDDDGVPDLLAGAPGEGQGAGAAYALSGADGALQWKGTGQPGDGYGHSVGTDPCASDDDPGVVVGATQAPLGQGYVELRTRGTFALRATFGGAAAGDRFGTSAHLAGDLDADGTPDVVAGSDPRDAAGQPSAPGTVRAYSGATGQLLRVWSGGLGTGLGLVVEVLGDVDGDGHDDLALGEAQHGNGAGRVRVFSGRNGNLLHELHGATGSDGTLGARIVTVGDLDGDGLPDFATSAPGDDGAGVDAGLVLVVSFTPWSDAAEGVPGGLGAPRLSGQGSLSAQTEITLSLREAPPGAAAKLVTGPALVYDAQLGILQPQAQEVVQGLCTGSDGTLQLSQTWPSGWPSDALVYYQYLVADDTAPGGFARSNTISGRTP